MKMLLFTCTRIFSKRQLSETKKKKKKFPSNFKKLISYRLHFRLQYIKIETNNESGIKMCQMHKNFLKSVQKRLGQGRDPECNNKKMQ